MKFQFTQLVSGKVKTKKFNHGFVNTTYYGQIISWLLKYSVSLYNLFFMFHRKLEISTETFLLLSLFVF